MDRNSAEPNVRFVPSRGSRLARAYARHELAFSILVLVVLAPLTFLVYSIHGGIPSVFVPPLVFFALLSLLCILTAPLKLFLPRWKSARAEEPPRPNPYLSLLVLFLGLDFAMTFLLSLAPQNVRNLFREVEFSFSGPSMVVADSEGAMYVLSKLNNRVQKYDHQGRFEFGWFSLHPSNDPGLAIDAEDTIYLLTTGCDTFSSSGELLKTRTGMGPRPYGYGAWFLDDTGEVTSNRETPEPEPSAYAHRLQPGDTFPFSPAHGSYHAVGFEAADGTRYTIRHLWWLFPAVEVTRDSEHVRWIHPNLFSMPLSYMYPGFLLFAALVTFGIRRNRLKGVRILFPRQEREKSSRENNC